MYSVVGIAHGLRQPLGAQLVHADGRAHDTAAGVGHAEEFQRALQRAVLAARPVQRDEHAVEIARDELVQRLVARIEGMRIDAALEQRLQAGVAREQRDLALARGAAEQHRDAAEFARLGDVPDDLGIVAQAHQSGSPTVRNSGVSCTPNFFVDLLLDQRHQPLDVGGGGRLDIDQEIGVFGRHHDVADARALEARGLDEPRGVIAAPDW